MTELDAWTIRSTAHLPIETRIVRKVVKTLKAAGKPVLRVWDGEEMIDTPDVNAVLNAVFAVDVSWLHTEEGYVLIVLGNEWDAVTDYTLTLEDALKPYDEWYDKYAE